MVHVGFSEAYINFSLLYTIDHIFTVLPIKDFIKKDGDPTTPFKFVTCTKISVSHLRVLFCPCAVWKATAQVVKKALNMRHQAQNGLRGIFVGIPLHKNGNLCTYQVQGRKYLHMMLFLINCFLVR